jgi:hypothetical protein
LPAGQLQQQIRGRWEMLLVDEQERTADKYGGYSLVIPFERLETHCSRR